MVKKANIKIKNKKDQILPVKKEVDLKKLIKER